MLHKKKKNPKDDHQNSENNDNQDIPEEIEALNEDDQTQKDDLTEAETTVDQNESSAKEQSKTEDAYWNDKYMRLYAEFDNFKRRTSKERIDLFQTAGKDVIVNLLPVLDDFERALKSMETSKDIESIKEGVSLVHHKLKNVLSQKGLKEMVSKGELFDADLHEGITSIPAQTNDLKGKVIDEAEKGYYLNDKVIRFAKVIVGA
ncbi:MAG: nucleotide exchange factor GrpE [Daejeonella sp.]